MGHPIRYGQGRRQGDEAGDDPDAGVTRAQLAELGVEASDGEEGGTQYDQEWGARAAKTMW